MVGYASGSDMEGAAPRLDRLERQERASTIGATRRLTRPVQSITQAAVQGADLPTRGETPSILLSVRVCGVARPSVESARETEAEIEAAAKRHTTFERRWTLALSSVFLLGQCGRQIDGFLFIESDAVTHHQCVRFNQSTGTPRQPKQTGPRRRVVVVVQERKCQHDTAGEAA